MSGRAFGQRVVAWGVALAVWALTPAVRAEVDLRLALEHGTVVRMEAAHAFLTVSNSSRDRIWIDPQRPKGAAWVDFAVRGMSGRRPVALSGKPAPIKGILEPGESRRYLVDLTALYGLVEQGTYNVNAVMGLGDVVYESRMVALDVVGGIPLKQVSAISPVGARARRTYVLLYLVRGGREDLLLSVDEPSTQMNLGVFPMGPVVRVFDPVLEVDGAGRVTVVHQTGPQQYARTLLETTETGMRMVDQSYETLHGRVGADGKWTAPGAKPIKPPPAREPEPRKKGLFGF